MRHYLIIGSGAAGIAAVEAIRSQDTQGKITLISDDAFGYYSRPGLAYYLSGEIPEEQLYPLSANYFKQLNVKRLRARVVRILPDSHQLQLTNGAALNYDRLLIATGASANQMQVPGVQLEGVVKLDTLDDARHILKLARRTRAAVVVGGGITALELVEGFLARGIKTHYFLRGDRYWKNVLDETESKIVEHRLIEDGVQVHYRTELAEIYGQGNRVAGVRTKDGRQIKCNMVAIAIGIHPRKQLAVDAGLEVERGILVDQSNHTRAADIFAAGDVAQTYDPQSGKFVLDSLWGPAREQGKIAGLNMAGITASYHKSVPFNVTRLANLTTTIIGAVGRGNDADLLGIARGDSETWRQLPDAIAAQADFDVNRLRILIGWRTLLGGIVMGDQTLSQPLHHLVTHKVDITPIRRQLLQPAAPLVDIIADFWTQWRQHSAQKQPHHI